MYLNFKHELTMFLTYMVKKNFHLNEKIISHILNLEFWKLRKLLFHLTLTFYDMH